MSLIRNGIFGDPSGSTGGITFGKARTRLGKVATARTKTSPANPNTVAQQAQRSIFGAVQDIVRRLGSAIYRVDWNRAIGQLPGFQSMQSLFMNQMASSLDLSLDIPINLGTLSPFILTVVSQGDPGEFVVEYPATITGVGTADDIVVILAIPKTAAGRAVANSVAVGNPAFRSSGDTTVIVPDNLIAYEFYGYFQGAGVAEGLLSVAEPFQFTP